MKEIQQGNLLVLMTHIVAPSPALKLWKCESPKFLLTRPCYSQTCKMEAFTTPHQLIRLSSTVFGLQFGINLSKIIKILGFRPNIRIWSSL